MNVLSLFDGMSCAQIALNRIGKKPDVYYASEVDKYAIKVTMANWPQTIQIGDVRNIDVSTLGKIDLLVGGSPCQSFSFAGKRKGMSTKDNIEILTLEHYLELKSQNFEFEGQSYLFWEYMRVLKDIQKHNPDVKFLLENVIMGEKWQKILTRAIGINPIRINAALVSAQNRDRLWWTNIGAEQDGLFGDLVCKIPQPKDKGILLRDVLESEVDEKYYLSDKIIKGFLRHNETHKERGNGFEFRVKEDFEKSSCLSARYYKMGVDDTYIVASCGRNPENPTSREPGLHTEQQLEPRLDGKTNYLTSVQKDNLVFTKNYLQYDLNEGRIRRLTPIECERLQQVDDNYTNHVSTTQRYKMLGNGWCVAVAEHIFKYL